ncbi:MAG: tripartite tricarboxylate transporter substrate binding protein [Pseudomonadota bacterium]
MVAAVTILVSATTFGETYPTRPIRMIVPSAAGTSITDMMARLVGPPLGAALGQAIVVDNRAGAGGIMGMDMVSKAAPDGYTIVMANIALAVNRYLYPSLPFDPEQDLLPVTMVNSAPLLLLVHPTVAATSVQELIALAKAHPGEINYGSGGVGSTPHLAGELFKSLAGIDIVHVPYKSGPPAVADLLGGQVSFMLENMPATMPFVRDGKLRALAITSAQRSPLAPDLPTVAQAGVPGYEMIGWNGILATKGTPPEIVARLHDEVAKILRTPEMTQQFAALGAEPVGDTPEHFRAFIKAEMARWGTIIKKKISGPNNSPDSAAARSAPLGPAMTTQQIGQFARARQMLEPVDGTLHLIQALRRQRRAGERPEFLTDLRLVVGIQAIAARTVAAMRRLPPVLQRQRDAGRLQGRNHRAQRRILGDMDAVAQRRDRGIVQRRVVDRLVAGAAAHGQTGRNMRQRVFRGEVVRRIRVAHRGCEAEGRDVDPLDILRFGVERRDRRLESI